MYWLQLSSFCIFQPPANESWSLQCWQKRAVKRAAKAVKLMVILLLYRRYKDIITQNIVY